MTDAYVRYADWCTLSRGLAVVGLAVAAIGADAVLSGMATVQTNGPPFAVASEKVIQAFLPLVASTGGMMLVLFAANLRATAERMKPAGLEVPA